LKKDFAKIFLYGEHDLKMQRLSYTQYFGFELAFKALPLNVRLRLREWCLKHSHDSKQAFLGYFKKLQYGRSKPMFACSETKIPGTTKKLNAIQEQDWILTKGL